VREHGEEPIATYQLDPTEEMMAALSGCAQCCALRREKRGECGGGRHGGERRCGELTREKNGCARTGAIEAAWVLYPAEWRREGSMLSPGG
jgi:hypothetical protein